MFSLPLKRSSVDCKRQLETVHRESVHILKMQRKLQFLENDPGLACGSQAFLKLGQFGSDRCFSGKQIKIPAYAILRSVGEKGGGMNAT